MAVFLRPDRGAVATKSIKANLTEGAKLVQLSTDGYCLSLVSAAIPSLLFDKEGESVKDGVLKSGQRASLVIGELSATKYHLMLIPNPELARSAYIGGPLMLEPYTSERLDFMLKVERQIDVSKLDYLFRIYIMD